jgi:hypothetical protein
MQPGPLIEERSTGQSTVYYLYRYRRFSDEFESLHRILSENLWWFGSRTGFDDSLDCVLGGIKLTPTDIERKVRESGGTESDLRRALNDSTLAIRAPKSVQKKSIDSAGILCLSEFPDHPKLWRDYADRGHGACLCLDVERLLASPDYSHYKPQEVHYVDAPPHIWNPEAEDQLAETAATLLCKNRKWQYQGEFRIMWPNGVGNIECLSTLCERSYWDRGYQRPSGGELRDGSGAALGILCRQSFHHDALDRWLIWQLPCPSPPPKSAAV